MATVTIPSPIDAVIDAINRGDRATFLASFAADGVVDDAGAAYRGADIANWNDRELIGAKGHMTVTRAKVEDGKIVVVGDWNSSFYSGRSRMEFTVVGGKVSELRIVPP